MNRDILAYIAMGILGTATVVTVVVGAAKDNMDLLLMGVAIGAYVVIIGSVTSAKSELKTEIKGVKKVIKNSHKLSKVG